MTVATETRVRCAPVGGASPPPEPGRAGLASGGPLGRGLGYMEELYQSLTDRFTGAATAGLVHTPPEERQMPQPAPPASCPV
jgi:hypothetical protein